jgi:hypothetical protein
VAVELELLLVHQEFLEQQILVAVEVELMLEQHQVLVVQV